LRPEAAQFLDIARNMLARGLRMLEADLIEDCGRTAYLAVFHAAQALIHEPENRTLKTHRGVQSEFSKLIRDEPSIPADLRGFVSRAYAFKTIADYDPLTGPWDSFKISVKSGCQARELRAGVTETLPPPR
jgi:uncharacterized protein (UPF0332 family)